MAPVVVETRERVAQHGRFPKGWPVADADYVRQADGEIVPWAEGVSGVYVAREGRAIEPRLAADCGMPSWQEQQAVIAAEAEKVAKAEAKSVEKTEDKAVKGPSKKKAKGKGSGK